MGLRYRSYHSETDRVYFVTTSVMKKENIFINEDYYTILLNSLKFVLNKYNSSLIAYVLMPNHLHIIVSMFNNEKISDLMRDFKKFTSTKIREQLETDDRNNILRSLRENAKGNKNQVFKLWQDRFDDLIIFTDKILEQKINYIHYNPVKRGLVKNPEDWKYSSYKYYYYNEKGLIDIGEP